MMFYILGRLGLSLVLGTWMNQPYFTRIPDDATLLYSKGFLVVGLLWEPVVLPGNGIHPSKFFGIPFDIVLIISFIQVGKIFWIPFTCLHVLKHEFKMRTF